VGGTSDKQRTRVWIGVGLLVLLALSAVVAWRIPIPATVPAVAWNSSWVFRAEVFVGVFIVAYLLVTIVVTTLRTGQPPGKLSFGLVSYEETAATTVDALGESRTALLAVQREVDGLRRQMSDVLAASRDAHEGLLAMPGDDAGRARSREHIETLGRVAAPAPAPAGEAEFDEAMARLERSLAELDAMLARPRRASRGG
jgi:hypothetical protein